MNPLAPQVAFGQCSIAVTRKLARTLIQAGKFLFTSVTPELILGKERQREFWKVYRLASLEISVDDWRACLKQGIR